MVVLGRSIVTIGLVLAATTACTGATVAEPVASRAGSATIHSATISPTPGLATRSALPRAAVTRVVSPLLFGLYPGVADAPNVVSGSSRLLQGVQWADLNPTAKPKDYNWAPLDAQVRSGVAHGVRDFLLVLGMTPHWASSRPDVGSPWGPYASAAPPRNAADFQTFVHDLALRNKSVYGGRITSFEVWNEANLSTFWTGTPAQMADLTARADVAIKSVNPRWSVVAASTTTRLGIASGSGFFPRYLSALSTVRGFHRRPWPIDAYSAHLYPNGSGSPADRGAGVTRMREILDEVGAPHRPLWDTEVNYGLAGPGPTTPHRSISGATAAEYVARTYLDSIRWGLDRVYWYEWAPANNYLGITMYRGTAAARSLATVQGWLSRSTFLGCTGYNLHDCRFRSGAKTFRVVWSDLGSSTISTRGARVSCLVAGPIGGICARVKRPTLVVRQMPVRLT